MICILFRRIGELFLVTMCYLYLRFILVYPSWYFVLSVLPFRGLSFHGYRFMEVEGLNRFVVATINFDQWADFLILLRSMDVSCLFFSFRFSNYPSRYWFNAMTIESFSALNDQLFGILICNLSKLRYRLVRWMFIFH